MTTKGILLFSPSILSTFLVVHLAAYSTLTHTAAAAVVRDRLALLAIKSMITDDPQGVLASWNHSSIHFCKWEGVTCSTRHLQRVTLLDLSSRSLIGTLSPSIGNLTFLRWIRLQNNTFSGEIPAETGRLFRLKELSLYNNSFQGNIPTAITNCTNLQILHLGHNNLVGKIPDGVGSLLMLNTLILHRNIFDDAGIPAFVGKLKLLQELSLGDCQLGGSIPDVFHRLTNLVRLSIPGNNLVGSIPPSIYNLSSLQQLILNNNRLTGRLPENLGSIMPRLEVFSVSDNRLTGRLPPSILSSPELTVLDVAQNNLSGKLVITSRNTCKFVILKLSRNSFGTGEDDEMKFIDDLSICRELGVLDLSNNQLRGFLPESLGNLSTKLYSLKVASNHFSGGLPSSVGNLSGLTLLDLSGNQFTGAIPETIGDLVNIGRIDLRNNSFSGNIPSSLGNLSLMIDLYLSSNRFNGTIPSSLGKCKGLLRLNLDRNNLSGEIPLELFELVSLSITLNLGSNQLSGQLPQEVGNLRNLNEIILSNNRLSSELPSSIGNCSSLQNLNLSNNLFSGPFPASLGSLRALENLDVSHNNFTGEIPTYLELLHLRNLNMSFNGFEGEVLRKGVFANASSVSIAGNGRLCGGIPELQLPNCSSSKKKKKKKLILAVTYILVPILLAVAIVLCWRCCRRKKEMYRWLYSEDQSFVTQITYDLLYKATDGFSSKNLIGEGSFSSVYKGFLDTNSVIHIVAIKVLNLSRRGGPKSFVTECETLRNARHRNLTRIVTCCSRLDFQGNEFKAIVYEFMPNGSLDQWLHDDQKRQYSPLTLLQRVCIALDVAKALDYLHHHAGKTIIHCDLKPSNILLDEDMVAHVGDFGLSEILHSEYQYRYNSSSVGVRGTIGYTAPEYGVGSRVSRSGDMYSYGILLLEMITNKKPTDALLGDGLSLHNYAKTAMGYGELGIVDPVLLTDDGKITVGTNEDETTTGYINKERCLRILIEIGLSCSMESPQYRMHTTSVIQALHKIKDALLGDSTVFKSSVETSELDSYANSYRLVLSKLSTRSRMSIFGDSTIFESSAETS